MLSVEHPLVNQSQQTTQPKFEREPLQSLFGGFMAKLKFRSLVAEVAEKKFSDAIIHFGATNHSFHRRSSLITYRNINCEVVK